MIKAEINRADINKALGKFERFSKKKRNQIEYVINEGALKVESSAKQNAPVDMGALRSSIKTGKFGELGREVFTKLEYAPYVEFGTKSKVDIPPGLESYALQFKGRKGDFDTLLQNIKGWARRKGLDPGVAYPIAVKIAREGRRAQPYLFPAFEQHRPRIIRNLKRVING